MIDEKLMKRNMAALKWANTSESLGKIKAMAELGRSEPGAYIDHALLDCDPFLFNCINGTLNLRDGVLREHRREDLITKLCRTAYHADATCPTWLDTLNRIFNGNADLVAYLQRLCGYCLTGTTTEQVLPIFWGDGSNGKSLIMETVRAVIGPDYATVGADALLTGGDNQHPTFLANLFGKRLVTLAETAQGRGVNESLIKKLTGSDAINARRMGEDFWSFNPTHKIWLATNHKPRIIGLDHGIWRRVRLVPFTTRFWDADRGESGPEHLKADKRLAEKLSREMEGVLAWMVRGCLEWQKNGLREPEEVRLATEEYRSQEDTIGRFLDECTISNKAAKVKAGDIYQRFRTWFEKSGEAGRCTSQKSFGDEMTRRGFEKIRSNGLFYVGIDLVANGCDQKKDDEVAF